MTADFRSSEGDTHGHGSAPLTARFTPPRQPGHDRGNQPGPPRPDRAESASGADGPRRPRNPASGLVRLLVGRSDDGRDSALRDAGEPVGGDDRAETGRLLAEQARDSKSDGFHDDRVNGALDALNRAYFRWDHARAAVRALPVAVHDDAWDLLAARLLVTVGEVRMLRTSHPNANPDGSTRPGATRARTRDNHTRPGYAT